MPKTVNAAFDIFKKDTVNLDPDETSKARSSRDWLLKQIASFPSNDDEFPLLYSAIDIQFGSFARKTKIRELDDIDMMIGLHAEGGNYNEYSNPLIITVSENATRLKKYCNDNSMQLNSKRIINKFVSNLKGVSQYENADIKRNQEAATLKLKSYTWNFDIVPCFITSPDTNNRTYYLIPDGQGNWKKTDPRLDRDRVINLTKEKGANIYNVIRIIKYWNKRPTMPTMSSYLIENMILDYYDNKNGKVSDYVDLEIPDVLNYISTNVYYQVNDPKNIQGNINDLAYEDKVKISDRAKQDNKKSVEARNFETNQDHKSSINKWREIFGDKFPEYSE